jgi:hypothetical protein
MSKFQLGTKAATQDFLNNWESTTKFEGTFIGHTYVAQLAREELRGKATWHACWMAATVLESFPFSLDVLLYYYLAKYFAG